MNLLDLQFLMLLVLKYVVEAIVHKGHFRYQEGIQNTLLTLILRLNQELTDNLLRYSRYLLKVTLNLGAHLQKDTK